MSKSYGRYKTIGICTGSNTEYYRDRVRSFRTKNKQRLRNALANFNVEDFDDIYIDYRQPKKNDWDEPTDGTWLLDPNTAKSRKFKGIYVTKFGNKIKK